MSKRRVTARRASLVAGSILLFCAVAGGYFFKTLNISVPALRIAGGILLLLISIDMLNARSPRAKGTSEEHEEGALKDDIAVFPLAIPLLSGPGAIVSVFILSERAQGGLQHAALYLSIIVVVMIVFLTLNEAHRIATALGQIGMNILSRLMGLVLASTAAQFLIDGLKGAFPALN